MDAKLVLSPEGHRLKKAEQVADEHISKQE
jgi:hypothetical protein